ncbi:hypothetical protein IV102_38535 [bacterium]|nr:hypothetical protein [bacterium]
MDIDASAAFNRPLDPARAHWFMWELGLLVALVTIIATPAESDQQAALGILSLLFLMGLAQHRGRETP